MKILEEYANKYSIVLTGQQLAKFKEFYNFLIQENNKYNLTNITEEKDFVIKHILDSILPQKLFLKNANVVDIGCGAGFPSLPLKIVRDDLNITMIDSVNKKVNFCNMSIDKLNIKNIIAIHSRIEDFALKNKEKFDVCCSRAVANLSTLLEYALPLLKLGGVCIFYKSLKLEEELSMAQNALKVLGGQVLSIENFDLEDNERKVVVIKKIKPTPKGYPRGANKPRLKPL